MSDKFQMSVGQAHELEMAFGRSGWTNADVKKLATGGTLARILSVMRGEAEVKFPEITVGGRVYEILPFLRGDEKSVNGNTMVARAKKIGANPGEEDGQHILKHQRDIPPVLCGKVRFTFPSWSSREGRCVADIRCVEGSWIRDWRYLSSDWGEFDYLLRRKTA